MATIKLMTTIPNGIVLNDEYGRRIEVRPEWTDVDVAFWEAWKNKHVGTAIESHVFAHLQQEEPDVDQAKPQDGETQAAPAGGAEKFLQGASAEHDQRPSADAAGSELRGQAEPNRGASGELANPEGAALKITPTEMPEDFDLSTAKITMGESMPGKPQASGGSEARDEIKDEVDQGDRDNRPHDDVDRGGYSPDDPRG